MLVDNTVLRKGLLRAWGFSAIASVSGSRILFDTGPDPWVLSRNASALGIDLSRISAVVISHLHGDHTGGLPAVAANAPGVKTYLPEPYGVDWVRGLGLEPVVNKGTGMILPGAWVIGPTNGPIPEQALAIGEPGELVLLVGCSHPGTDRLAELAVREVGGVAVVAGGMHLIGAPAHRVAEVVDRLADLGVRKVYPMHCSGEAVAQYIEREYPGMLGMGGAGLRIVA